MKIWLARTLRYRFVNFIGNFNPSTVALFFHRRKFISSILHPSLLRKKKKIKNKQKERTAISICEYTLTMIKQLDVKNAYPVLTFEYPEYRNIIFGKR